MRGGSVQTSLITEGTQLRVWRFQEASAIQVDSREKLV